MKNVMRLAAVAVMLTVSAWAQQLPGAPSIGGPSPEELAEVQKIAGMQIQTVADVDAQVKAIDAFVQNYPSSQFKGFMLGLAGEASQRKGDRAKALFYYEEVLKIEPKDYQSINAMLMIAAETAQDTPEFALNKEQRLGRAEKLANDAIAMLDAVAKPNPQVTEEQWTAAKKDDRARAHEALGMIAMARKNWNAAAEEFRKAIDSAANPQITAPIRLGGALNEAGKYDEAIAALNTVLAMQGVPDQIRQVAENEKKRSEQLKAAKK
jgi:tetratricopeptide (TPR) repeat protein